MAPSSSSPRSTAPLPITNSLGAADDLLEQGAEGDRPDGGSGFLQARPKASPESSWGVWRVLAWTFFFSESGDFGFRTIGSTATPLAALLRRARFTLEWV